MKTSIYIPYTNGPYTNGAGPSSQFRYWEDIYEELIELGADSKFLGLLNKDYNEYISTCFENLITPIEVATSILENRKNNN